jgi:Tfp pilus assembly pilus retraction ATPase PilT
MKKQEVDHILTRMLDSHSNVSDLNLTVGKPLQVESSGELVPVEIKPEIRELTPFQTETFALNLVSQDRRLTETLIQTGSCDLSYSLPGKGPLSRQHFFTDRTLFHRIEKAGIQDPHHPGLEPAGHFLQNCQGTQWHRIRYRRHRFG